MYKNARSPSFRNLKCFWAPRSTQQVQGGKARVQLAGRRRSPTRLGWRNPEVTMGDDE